MTPKQEVTSCLFLSEIDALLAELSIRFSSVVIAGDINIHMELPNDQFSIGFLEVVSDHGFTEQVKGVRTHNTKVCVPITKVEVWMFCALRALNVVLLMSRIP